MKQINHFWKIYCYGQKNFQNELENRGREGEEIALYTLGVLAMKRLRATEAISIDGKNSAGDEIPSIHDLMNKAVSRLHINSCNVGNLAYYYKAHGDNNRMNVASVFSEKIGEDSVVYAFDGNVSFGPRSWEFWKEKTGEPRLSSFWSQTTYNEYVSKYTITRPKPRGKVMYHNGKLQNYFPDTAITAR